MIFVRLPRFYTDSQFSLSFPSLPSVLPNMLGVAEGKRVSLFQLTKGDKLCWTLHSLQFQSTQEKLRTYGLLPRDPNETPVFLTPSMKLPIDWLDYSVSIELHILLKGTTMKKLSFLFVAFAIVLVSAQAHAFGGNVCLRSVKAVLDTLDCIENEDVACAAGAYADSFVKLHNGVDTQTVISAESWGGAFLVSDFAMDIDHVRRVGLNEVSIRYVETVEFTPSVLGFPFELLPIPDQTFIQHEHALVTLNSDCQITSWDQYGDNQEQDDLNDTLDALFAILAQYGL
jgi:hypothetical protein